MIIVVMLLTDFQGKRRLPWEILRKINVEKSRSAVEEMPF